MNVDPIVTAIVEGALTYASHEMGIAVRNAAYSPNIKERLDHSCALFDARGRLIAQAEHIPVHLGSLPWGVERTLAFIQREFGGVAQGDMWMVNDPYVCGTHINDVTLVRPIYFEGALAGYAANKAHHADVGGSVPGSISIDAADLFAEGLVITPMHLLRGDALLDEAVALLCANSREPAARAGDLRAQVAGNIVGERRLLALFERYGRATLDATIDHLLDDAERRMRTALRAFGDGVFQVTSALEDPHGDPSLTIALRLELADGTATLDYTGTHAQVSYPLNAVFGVTLSGVYYALRAVVGPTIPANAGTFRPIIVSAPEGTLVNPTRPAPVGGGNVETSTRNAELVLRALACAAPDRVPAESGGTMSNVMLGGVRSNGHTWAFYETIGCGMGARPGLDGLDGIQCHMTNTLNTPIEAIERQYPLRVTRYEFAAGTGGAGRYRGGDGLLRTLESTEGQTRATLLADRHHCAPAGALGGEPGSCGAHRLIRADGSAEPLGGKVSVLLAAGEAVEVQTPGGGGYGEAAGFGADLAGGGAQSCTALITDVATACSCLAVYACVHFKALTR